MLFAACCLLRAVWLEKIPNEGERQAVREALAQDLRDLGIDLDSTGPAKLNTFPAHPAGPAPFGGFGGFGGFAVPGQNVGAFGGFAFAPAAGIGPGAGLGAGPLPVQVPRRVPPPVRDEDVATFCDMTAASPEVARVHLQWAAERGPAPLLQRAVNRYLDQQQRQGLVGQPAPTPPIAGQAPRVSANPFMLGGGGGGGGGGVQTIFGAPMPATTNAAPAPPQFFAGFGAPAPMPAPAARPIVFGAPAPSAAPVFGLNMPTAGQAGWAGPQGFGLFGAGTGSPRGQGLGAAAAAPGSYIGSQQQQQQQQQQQGGGWQG